MGTTRAPRRAPADLFPYHNPRQCDALRGKADDEVARAIYMGLLVRSPCVVCGAEKSEAHHDDYRKPLDVIWLCREHHRERDALLREGITPPPVAKGVTPTLPKKRAYVRFTRVEHAEDLVRESTSAVLRAMEQEGVSQNALATQLGVSRQYLNMLTRTGFRTFKSLATVAWALGYEVRIELHRRTSDTEAA